ncbi:MAG: hypothetical protein BWY76_01352 [bacterium ADurb.Bin429]|nr:MAG: hypothetical protein BWY76_01352 [bacterium ADurb.Bin429]
MLQHLAGGITKCLFIQRFDDFSNDVGATRHCREGPVVNARQIIVVETEQQRAHLAAFALNDGIGRQGSAQRDEGDASQQFHRQLAHGVGDPSTEFVFRGERFGFRQYLLCGKFNQHGIRVGAAGVNPQTDRHVGSPSESKIGRDCSTNGNGT